MSYIHAENLVKQYGTGKSAVMAVGGMSFKIDMGEFVAVMGESGSGKSTLLSMMGALNTPTTGNYWVDELEVYALGQDRRADFRREFLGFIFQSFHLVSYLTLLENVMVPLVTVKMSSKEKRAMAEDALSRVGLNGKSHRLPGQTSGGEQCPRNCKRAAHPLCRRTLGESRYQDHPRGDGSLAESQCRWDDHRHGNPQP
jgi:putative ABC transport system ATP-binding protein